MSSYRLDKLQFLSNLPNFINVAQETATLDVSGTVGASSILILPVVTIKLKSASNFFTLYAYNNLTGYKSTLTSIGSLFYNYSNSSSEIAEQYITVLNNVVSIHVFINNKIASPVTLIPQTYTFTAVEYQLPF